MIVIKDAMVVIHLAKLSLLEKSCNYFENVLIPEEVHREILKGKEKEFPEIQVIEELIKNKIIAVKKVKDAGLIRKANQLNIEKGEGEAVALYWQENGDLLATDDDNVRKKRLLLNLNIIGTPAIAAKLYKESIISKEKAKQSISELKKIGWFSSTVLDKIIMEVENG